VRQILLATLFAQSRREALDEAEWILAHPRPTA
jgi:hypothetical protein